MAVYDLKRKTDKNDTLKEVVAFMSTHFLPARNEFAEIAAFGRATRLERELINDYLMRLRTLATHCEFEAGLEEELQRRFALHCGMLR